MLYHDTVSTIFTVSWKSCQKTLRAQKEGFHMARYHTENFHFSTAVKIAPFNGYRCAMDYGKIGTVGLKGTAY